MEPGRNFSYVDDEQKLLVNILRPPLRPEVQSTAERDDYDGVALMDLISGREIERYRNIRDRRASQDGSRFILTDGKNEAAIYDAQTGKVIKQLGNTASVTQRGKPGLPISGEGPTADYGGGLDRFFHRTEDGVTTMRRWSDGEVIADLGKLGSSSSAVTFPYGGKTFTTIGDDGVYTIRDMSNGAPLATFGRVNVFDYREDRIIITRDRTRRTLLAVEPVAHLRGMALRERVCSPDINRDWVGPFTEAERDPKKAQDAESKDIARRLRGRPWHVCDWRGLRSLEGWGQMFRYWGVRFGLAKDWAPDERPGQPRPRAQKKAADAPKKKD
jgi:hypothetical protein